jgi:AcrR family transcriptional regulator
MADEVKREEPRAGRRGDQARATRRRIVDAAAALFIQSGYTSTTLEQIAEAAGVAVQTVYFHFGNKRTVLKEALDVAAVGDDEPIPVLERPWLQEARTATDPTRVVELWVKASRAILERSAPIGRVVRDAAAADPDVAALWATNEQQRSLSYQVMAQQLADQGALKSDGGVEQAADVLFALLSLEMFLVFTTTRRWTPERWQQWTIATLSATLLR